MCFSPQRRAIFRHRHFQNRSEIVVFCAFWLANVLFATAACNFWCHLSAPTSAPAALTGLLLDWPDTRIYEKTQHFVTSLTFGADVSSFLLTFWLLHLLSTDLTTLLLLFNSPYCRKFLFKLPSMSILSQIESKKWKDIPMYRCMNVSKRGYKNTGDKKMNRSSFIWLESPEPNISLIVSAGCQRTALYRCLSSYITLSWRYSSRLSFQSLGLLSK